MSDTPLYDSLIAERLGRGPTEFEGHDTWDESEEAQAAYDRGVADAESTAHIFWGHPAPAPAKPPAKARQRRRGRVAG